MTIIGAKPSLSKSALTVVLADYIKKDDAFTESTADTRYLKKDDNISSDKVTGLSTVATTGNYSDLIGAPSEVTSDIVANWGFVQNEGLVRSIRVNNNSAQAPDMSGTVDITIPEQLSATDIENMGFMMSTDVVRAVNGSTPDESGNVSLSIPTSATVSGWGFTKNQGTVTGSGLTQNYVILGNAGNAIKASSYTINASVPSDARFTDTVTTATTSGTGNAVTAVEAVNGALTITKGTTFLTEHQSLADYVTLSGAEALTNKTYEGYTLGAACAKGIQTTIGSTDSYVPTSKAVKDFVEGKGYKTTDNNTTYTFAEGTVNGAFSVTPSKGTAVSVPIHGIPSSYAPTDAEKNVITTVKVNSTALTPDTDRAVNITVPTKVSDLTNDAGYITGYTEQYTGTYSKPSGGIPKSDLASDVQTSLGKADTALQEHQSLDAYQTKLTAGTDYVQPSAISDMETKTHASATYQPKGNYLTAHQSLDDYAKKSDLASVYRVKGTKTYAQIIALTDAKVGDVYNASDNGANYVCITANTAGASSWDKLSETVDLSGYALKTEIPTIPGLSKGTTTGTGNAVTDISVNGHTITLTKGTTFLTAHQSLADYVKGPASAVDARIAVFNGTTGKLIKDSGYTIATSVPANAKFTDTDTKVTSVENHYSPAENTASALSASGGTLTDIANSANGVQVVTGLKRDAAGHVVGVTSVALKSTNNTYSTSNFLASRPASIEFLPGASAGHGGFLDFHYNNSTADNTSRIIESASGTLSVNGVTFSDSKINSFTLADACAKNVVDTAGGTLNWTGDVATNGGNYVPTVKTMAYWNGCYTGTNSNLTYCKKGAFGDVVTHNASEFAASSHGLHVPASAAGDAGKVLTAGSTANTSSWTALPTYLTKAEQTTTSTADAGSNVVTFTDSSGATSTLTVKNGNKGSTGTRGSVWNSGTACTGTNSTATVYATGLASSLVGDMYLNTSTWNLYKCTTAGNASTAKWTLQCNIRGATGSNGSNGTNGSNGLSIGSVTGPTTVDTGSGKGNTYSVKLSSGTEVGTFTVYNGAAGSNGTNGTNGTSCTHSWSGTTLSVTSASGTSSANLKGATGTRGSLWNTGTALTHTTGAATTATGISGALVGDVYLNTSTWNLYKCTTAGNSGTAAWTYQCNIRGAAGSNGTNGTNGSNGLSIGSVTAPATVDTGSGKGNTYTVKLSSGTQVGTFTVYNGAQGGTGAAAGFGTPTATVDATTGTPAVTITASGANTAKVFNFAFTGLKGEKGDPGTNATTTAMSNGTSTAGLIKTTSTVTSNSGYTACPVISGVPYYKNTTYSNFVKSGTGAAAGLVPAPSTTAGTTKYLREDGTWQAPPNSNTTYAETATNKGTTIQTTVKGLYYLTNVTIGDKTGAFLQESINVATNIYLQRATYLADPAYVYTRSYGVATSGAWTAWTLSVAKWA